MLDPARVRASSPPRYEDARNRRQKVRSAGMDPNYWYPVEYESALGRGRVQEVKFWDRSFALFRGDDGAFRAVENRCAHRQLRLSAGAVRGCNLVCAYHGWEYDGSGKLVNVPHERFDRPLPRVGLLTQPVQVRYGLIWVFFGDPERARQTPLPTIPELEGPTPWPCVPIDFTWRAHHSMIIDNVSDFTHAHLHRRYKPFTDAKLEDLRTEGDCVTVRYTAKIARGPIYEKFVDHELTDTNQMTLCYEYPFQWSNTGDRIKHHCFILPVDRTTSRVFFLFYYDTAAFKLPYLSVRIPRRVMYPILHIANRVLMRPLLNQDGMAVEEEQLGYDRHFEQPAFELNPAIHAFQALTVRKWEEHLVASAGRGQTAVSALAGE